MNESSFSTSGCVPVTIRPPHPQNVATTLPTVKMIVEVSKSSAILTSGATLKVIKSKEALAVVDARAWPPILDTDDLPKKKLTAVYKAPTPEMICYIDFSVSTTGMLAGVKVWSNLVYKLHFHQMSLVTRKPVFGVCNQGLLRPACSATETS